MKHSTNMGNSDSAGTPAGLNIPTGTEGCPSDIHGVPPQHGVPHSDGRRFQCADGNAVRRRNSRQHAEPVRAQIRAAIHSTQSARMSTHTRTLSTHALLTQNCSTCSHNEERARACVPAVPSGSNASDVASTTAPHCAASFEFSAESAEIVVSRFAFAAVRFVFAAVSSVFAAVSFSFRAVSAPILSTYLRRARHDSCRGVKSLSDTGQVAVLALCLRGTRPAAWTPQRVSHGFRRTLREAAPSALGGRPGRGKPSARRAAQLAIR